MLTGVVDRFWAKVEVRAPDECWPWTGATALGYGVLGAGPRGAGNVKAHRVSYEIHHGPIPRGMFVCHRCDNPPCCNPAHLFAGTPADNARDMTAKGRHGRWTHPERTARGSRHGSAVLTEPAVRQIVRRLSAGLTLTAAAHEFGVHVATVWDIAHGRSWRHITQEVAP